MRNSGVRVQFKESGSYKIGSKSYDIIAGNLYCFINMTPEECAKFKSSYNNKLEFFKVTTNTSGAYSTIIYQAADRAKNFAKAASKMPKREKKIPEVKEEIEVVEEKTPDEKSDETITEDIPVESGEDANGEN